MAKAFSGAIRGKTVLVTGVNRGGIGFSTAEAFVSAKAKPPKVKMETKKGQVLIDFVRPLNLRPTSS